MRALWEGIRNGLELTVVRPLRDGRPRLRECPPALRLLLWFSLPLSVALLAVFLIGYYAFDESANTAVIDSAPLWFGTVLVGWTLVFGHLLAPLLPIVWRILAWVALGLSQAPLAATTYHRLDRITLGPIIIVAEAVGIVVLVLAAIAGCRRGGGTSHVLLTLAGVGCSVLAPLLIWQSDPTSSGIASAALAFYALALIVLAGPMLIAGSMAFTQLSIEVADATTVGFGRSAAPAALWTVFIVLAVLGATVWSFTLLRFGTVSLGGLIADVAMAAFAVAGIQLAVRLARRRPPAELPLPATMMDHFGAWVGIWAITIYLSSAVVGSVVQLAWLTPVALVGVGLWGCVRAIRRCLPAAAAVHAAVTLTSVGMLVARSIALPGLTTAGQTLVLIVGVVIVVLLGLPRMTRTRLLIATIAMAVIVAFPWRHLVFEPLSFLGPTTVGVVLFGVIWLAATAAPRIGSGTEEQALVLRALLVVGTTAALMIDPRAITVLNGYYDAGEDYVSRLMVPAVLVGLWEMWRFGMDPSRPGSPRGPRSLVSQQAGTAAT